MNFQVFWLEDHEIWAVQYRFFMALRYCLDEAGVMGVINRIAIYGLRYTVWSMAL